MAKFNKATSGKRKTINKAGGTAYSMDKKIKLVTQVLTSFFGEPKYYGDNTKEIVESIKYMAEVDPEFLSKLAIYAREIFYLRSIAHVIVAELAYSIEGKPYIRETIYRVVQRPDDMTEILAYYLFNYGKPIPNSLKKGISDCYKKFTEYHLAKYNRKQDVRLKDVLCLTRPNPENKTRASLWKKVLEDNLEVPVTWETKLSAEGNKKEVWEELIEENRLGYMALLRNLRNIIQSGAKNIDKVYNYLQDPDAIAKSKQLPFRFFSAYRELEHLPVASNQVFDVLENALEISASNLPYFNGTTFLVNDNSGSMQSTLSARSKITYNDVGSLLMSIAQRFCENSYTSVFGTNFKVVSASSRSGIIDNMYKFKNVDVRYSTQAWKAFKWLVDEELYVDRIILFSDMQCYSIRHGSKTPQQYVEEYKGKVNSNVWVHSLDLAGYGTQQFVGKNVNLMAGWNDKVLEFIKLTEDGIENLANEIETYN